MKIIMTAMLILILTGCASYEVKDAQGKVIETGSTGGFGRDLTHTRITTVTAMVNGQPVTTVTTDAISSTSNVAGVLGAVNGVLGTLVDGAGKLKP